MFEFKKLCNESEKLNPIERGALLVEKSVSVVKGLGELDADLPCDPVGTLVSFIVGSVASDGTLNEKDYLYIYPSLVKAFGKDFVMSAKQALQISKDVKKEISRYTENLMSVIAACDEKTAADIVELCLLVTSVDGKISLKEKRYIRRLCKT